MLSRVHQFRHKPSISQLLSILTSVPIGALAIVPASIEKADNTKYAADPIKAAHPTKADNTKNVFFPEYGRGCELAALSQLQSIATDIDKQSLSDEALEKLKLNMFARGSSVGGARPKVMVFESEKSWIAKFHKETDVFNYARVEHACLRLMALAGCSVAKSSIISMAQHDILLVERFDISEAGGRFHLATANAWLKSESDQTDPWWSSYDAIVKLIEKYSVQPREDNQQLFTQMLINRCLNNTDDHLRNFSFMCDITPNKPGWRLTPAYDVVPSLSVGQYHQLKVGYSDHLPGLAEAEEVHKNFNLTRRQAREIISRVKDVMSGWKTHFAQCGVSQKDIECLSAVIRTNDSAKL